MHLPRRARFVLSSSGLSRAGRQLVLGGVLPVLGVAGGLLAAPLRAAAQTPRDWQLGMQAPHSPVQARIEGLHDLLLIIITVITVFVAGLLLYVAWRYRHDRHPTPSRVSHNPVLEVAWTIVPVLILVVIAIPSFRLVYYEDRTREADLTIKVTGHQWYWEFAYPDQGNIDFSSYIVPDDQLKPGQLRLFAVDNQLVLPAGKKVRILTTSGDVIHSFFIPSLGVQRYAIPGRTIETWVEVDKPGDYYGECNQICGTNHSHMPIAVHAVTPDQFTAWVADAKKKYASNPVSIQAADAGASPVPSLPARVTLAQAQP